MEAGFVGGLGEPMGLPSGRVALVKQFTHLLRTYLTWTRHNTLWKPLSPLPCWTVSERQRAVCLGSPGDAITLLSDINPGLSSLSSPGWAASAAQTLVPTLSLG